MKSTGILLVLLTMFFVVIKGFRAEPAKKTTDHIPTTSQESPLYGAWDLTYGAYGIGTDKASTRNPGKAFQFKVFSDKHFVTIMQNQAGEWKQIGGGTYEIQGDQFIESYLYTEVLPLNESLSWNFERRGDTLLMDGPTEVSAGLTDYFEPNTMQEVRVKASSFSAGKPVSERVTGAWHLSYGSYTNAEGETNIRETDTPYQLSIYTPTHFAYVMQNGEGKWTLAGGGQHYMKNGTRHEHHIYNSNPVFEGWTATFDTRMEENMLVSKGPIAVTNAEGKDISKEFKNRWEEKRVRIE